MNAEHTTSKTETLADFLKTDSSANRSKGPSWLTYVTTARIASHTFFRRYQG
jgi:hypothetical protein